MIYLLIFLLVAGLPTLIILLEWLDDRDDKN
jgi:hypothetical protein